MTHSNSNMTQLINVDDSASAFSFNQYGNWHLFDESPAWVVLHKADSFHL